LRASRKPLYKGFDACGLPAKVWGKWEATML
jgi:hypothetical protein